jgi:hypothetical protein
MERIVEKGPRLGVDKEAALESHINEEMVVILNSRTCVSFMFVLKSKSPWLSMSYSSLIVGGLRLNHASHFNNW